jgi:hypothetical protein
MKLLIVTVVALVIPLFFVLVFVMSTVNKLTNLRRRCLDIRGRAAVQSAPEPQAQGEFNLAVEQYNAARRQFPTNLLATIWGFREMEPWG